MMKPASLLRAALAACLCAGAAPALAASIEVDVFAAAHSYNGGSGGGLATGIVLASGDSFGVSADPSDDWLVNPSYPGFGADGIDTLGPYTSAGLTANYSALVGRIGASGPYFLVGSAFTGAAAGPGELFLFNWDSNSSDNSGFITATITTADAPGADVPLPASAALLPLALGGLAALRRRG
ncbi:hypothetical protein ACQ5SO_09425 [Rhodovulum sp. DZ06]|uniref:hypothetical protein n=1 Tax=Rhodovulum sp. DZ06 TaxID=3425126 RepID=UPI003D32E4A9